MTYWIINIYKGFGEGWRWDEVMCMHYREADVLESYFFRYAVLDGRNRSHKHILIDPLNVDRGALYWTLITTNCRAWYTVARVCIKGIINLKLLCPGQ